MRLRTSVAAYNYDLLLMGVIVSLCVGNSFGSFRFTTTVRSSNDSSVSSQLMCPDAHCQHGGECDVENHVCKCTLGYAGHRCEYPLCTLACQNNGTCAGPNRCQCPKSYTGDQCQVCTNSGREKCPSDPGCAVWEDVPGVCCPPCRHRFWRGNCPAQTCSPVSGCVRYQYRNAGDCCPKCIMFSPSCMGKVCPMDEGCLQHALSVGRGKCCPRCDRYRCSGIECRTDGDCIEYDAPRPGQCCPRCRSRRGSCPGVTCSAVANCAGYVQKPGQCCAKCKRLKQPSKHLPGSNLCAGVKCPDAMECHARQGVVTAVCRCRRKCPKKKRAVCGSDGNLHRNRCRLLRASCLKAVAIRPVQMAFCTYYGPKIQKTLDSLQQMMTQTNSHTNAITLLGGLL